MPWIIDYQIVLERLQSEGMVCLYHNSGAFGFPKTVTTHMRGWIGPPDSTIKPAAWPMTRTVAEPHEQTLADLATTVWQNVLPGNIWVMPASHWSYELNHGSRDWMPALIENLDVDPGLLATRNNAAAIEFTPEESDRFRHMVLRLLEMLLSSDFALVFPQRATVCTLHHHKQLWWVTNDAKVVAGLDAVLAATGKSSDQTQQPGSLVSD
ncbi:MAG: hypothetical protein M3O30_08020 [Planctomycetota bacterium]|nr:hypothetical protein [Planctomycetota bacterium]